MRFWIVSVVKVPRRELKERGGKRKRREKRGKKGEQWINYLVFVDQHGSQVAVEEKLVRLDVDRALSPSLAAQRPLGIYQSPKRRSCKRKKKNTINLHEFYIDFLSINRCINFQNNSPSNRERVRRLYAIRVLFYQISFLLFEKFLQIVLYYKISRKSGMESRFVCV